VQRRSPALLACWLLLASSFELALARADEPVRVPVIFHVADSAEHRAPPEAFIREQLTHANAVYRPLGLELVDAGRESLPERHARLVTRADRDALLRYVRRGSVHCVVVASLMDVDEAGRERRGVHWRSRRSARHLVIVSTLSGPYVLAHELGHFFGNREHSETPGNLMSYTSAEGPPFLDAIQKANVRRTLQRMLRSKELHSR
jgi:hypothetical protein